MVSFSFLIKLKFYYIYWPFVFFPVNFYFPILMLYRCFSYWLRIFLISFVIFGIMFLVCDLSFGFI